MIIIVVPEYSFTFRYVKTPESRGFHSLPENPRAVPVVLIQLRCLPHHATPHLGCCPPENRVGIVDFKRPVQALHRDRTSPADLESGFHGSLVPMTGCAWVEHVRVCVTAGCVSHPAWGNQAFEGISYHRRSLAGTFPLLSRDVPPRICDLPRLPGTGMFPRVQRVLL